MLIGISLGPGDPELLTYKATKALARAKKVFVPGKMAADLVRPYAESEILEFPMILDKEELENIWAENAKKVATYASEGKTAFACIGDVNTFSTFSHLKRVLKELRPEIQVETIPGVGTVPALAAKFEIDLNTSFQVTDGSPVNTVIRMKATRPAKLALELEKEGYTDFILGTRLYTPEEKIVRGEMPEKSDYFSVLCATRR